MKPIISYSLLAIVLLLSKAAWPQDQGGSPAAGNYGAAGGTMGAGGTVAAPSTSYGMAPAGTTSYGAPQGNFSAYGTTPGTSSMSSTMPSGTYGAARGAYGSVLNNPSALSAVPNSGAAYGAAPGNAGTYGPATVTPTIPPGGATPFAGAPGGSANGIFPPGNPSASQFGGVSLSPGDIQTLLSSPEAQAILNNPTALNSLAQKFGISPNDIQNIRGQLSNGSLSPDQVTQLAGRLGGIQASPAEVASIANALGLSPPQIAQLQNAMAATSQQNPNAQPNQQGTVISSQQGVQLQQASAVEAKFHSLDVPGQVPSAPDLTSLAQFGYSLFSQPVSTFAPVTNVPVGDDYIIGPGDSLVALEWGLVNQSLEMTVDRDGSVQVPGVGPVQVGGLTFGQAKKLLEAQLERVHGVTANITMGQLRTIQVFVVGQVNQPGTYTVSSLSRISNVLQQAGGISKVGSLRRVELRRHNQLVDVLDLYDLMMRGDSSHDLRLDNNDVIFVPVIGKVVAVAGDVKVPAIYELESTPSIKQVLNLAGGVTAFGYAEHLQIERVENHQRTIVLDVNLDQLASRRVAIRDGDLIKIYPVLPQHTNIVTLDGHVHRPGEYQWYSGMHVSDLIQHGEGLLPHTYFSYALIKRSAGPEKYIHYVPVDLGAALSGGEGNPADLPLQQMDEIQVFSQDQLRDLPQVSVIGEVRSPGSFPLTEKMRLSDLIYQAGGLKDDANRTSAELARTQVGPDSKTYHTYMSVDLAPILSGDATRDIILANNDQIFIKVATNWHLPESVQLNGRVARPGPYVIRPGEQLSSLLLRCGGFLPDAFPQGIVLIRQSVEKQEQDRIEQAKARLSQQMAQYSLTLTAANSSNLSNNSNANLATAGIGTLQQLLAQASTEQAQGRIVVHFNSLEQLAGSSDDIVLEDQDTITIPKRPSSVAVLGQVNNPTAIIAKPGMTVTDYLYKAGGPTTNGDMSQLMLIKADGSVITEEGIKNGPRGSLFPLFAVTSGSIMKRTVSAGDTIYVPDNLQDIPAYLRRSERKDIAQIVASSAQTLAIVGILASNL